MRYARFVSSALASHSSLDPSIPQVNEDRDKVGRLTTLLSPRI